MGVAIAEGEVGGVVRHWVTFGLYSHPDVREREVGSCRLGHGNGLYGVSFMLVQCRLESVFKEHVGIERIVSWSCLLFCHGVVEWGGDLRLVGEELAQLEVCGEAVCLEVVGGALCHSLFKTSESVGGDASCEVQRTEVRQLHVKGSRCRPSALVVRLEQSELVHPNLSRLCRRGEVSYADEHGFHLTDGRISHDGDAVVGTVGVIFRVFAVV